LKKRQKISPHRKEREKNVLIIQRETKHKSGAKNMSGSSLLALIDDIAALLNDVAVMIKVAAKNAWGSFKRALSRGLIAFAPWLMKALSVIGTAAMFMVGGDILVYGVPGSHDVLHSAEQWVGGIPAVRGVLSVITPTLLNAIAGIIAGAIVLGVVTLGSKLFGKKELKNTDA
jgi:predicted DNA repair protein MutK